MKKLLSILTALTVSFAAMADEGMWLPSMIESVIGDMRPMTTEEILEDLSNEIEVEENDKGRIMFYYRDHAVDITDQIDENGIVKLRFKDGVLPTYITLKWKGGGGYVADFGTFGYKEIEEYE